MYQALYVLITLAVIPRWVVNGHAIKGRAYKDKSIANSKVKTTEERFPPDNFHFLGFEGLGETEIRHLLENDVTYPLLSSPGALHSRHKRQTHSTFKKNSKPEPGQGSLGSQRQTLKPHQSPTRSRSRSSKTPQKWTFKAPLDVLILRGNQKPIPVRFQRQKTKPNRNRQVTSKSRRGGLSVVPSKGRRFRTRKWPRPSRRRPTPTRKVTRKVVRMGFVIKD